jgi:hypothetical protein
VVIAAAMYSRASGRIRGFDWPVKYESGSVMTPVSQSGSSSRPIRTGSWQSALKADSTAASERSAGVSVSRIERTAVWSARSPAPALPVRAVMAISARAIAPRPSHPSPNRSPRPDSRRQTVSVARL